ncbi:4261_t:CDS:2 [Cetraspora pellucida]|uniref:4261_t:CDS:1 n=1 Tax=Cetraspora pellucida TaxID=1433469 RepID=A0A9N9IC01_9GLOM|nr:4261_t:CDS:2 [Cetraspora pellucida]
MSVAIKEMIHRMFKNMISHMNYPRFNTRTNAINNLARDPSLYTILSNWYVMENLSVYTNDQSIENRSDSNTVNNSKVESVGLSKSLDTKHPFFQDLYKAYDDYLNSKAALINKKLEFYNLIMYTVLEDNQDPV